MKEAVSFASGPSDSASKDNSVSSQGGRTSAPLNIFILHPSMILTNHRPSGDGLIAYEFITRLARRGHQVHVAVSLQDIEGELPPTLHLHDIHTKSTPSPFGAGLWNRIEFGLRAGALYRRLRKQIRFDVAHQFNPVVYGLCFFAAIRGVPLVMGPVPLSWPLGTEYANTLPRRLKKAVRSFMMSLQYRWAARVLMATPPAHEGKSQDKGLPPGTTICSYGIDPEAFRPASVQPSSTEPPTIMFLSNVWRRKGIFVLLDAFERVQQKMPGAQLVIAGSGSELDEVTERVKNHPAGQHIRLLGFVPREKVAATLQTCSVFCLPSFGEPFGMAALEAMSCGKPLVCTNSGGLAYLANPEGSIMVPPHDSTSLADALVQVLADPAAAQRMGQANRKYVLEKYSWDAIIDRLEGIYAGTLGSHVAASVDLVSQDAWTSHDDPASEKKT